MTRELDYIVVGASGFIGDAIIRDLRRRKFNVQGFDSKSANLLEIDSLLKMMDGRLNNAILIYAAGYPRLVSDDLNAFDDNVKMVENMVQVSLELLPAQVIYLSSVEVYGEPGSEPITESTTTNPKRLYAIGKLTGEMLWNWWGRQTKRPVKLVRLPGVFGRNDRGLGFIGLAAQAIKQGEKITLNNMGEDVRDYVYVEDVSRAIVELSLLQDISTLVNVATGISYRTKEIVDTLCNTLGATDVTTDAAKDGELKDISRLYFDTHHFRKLLPEFKFTPLQSAILSYRVDD